MTSNSNVKIGLIGDYDPAVISHQAIPRALALASEELRVGLAMEWVPTLDIKDPSRIADLDGFWCVPASPYKNMEGALCAIRFARETARPFLGTCGGFQHAIIEYARNVLKWNHLDHAEVCPNASLPLISPLSCSLIDVTDTVHIYEPSRLATAYQSGEISERYHCSYGLNPDFRAQLVAGPLRVTAVSTSGDVRAIELDNHPFFVATLFQPERVSLENRTPPIVLAFVHACAESSVVGGQKPDNNSMNRSRGAGRL